MGAGARHGGVGFALERVQHTIRPQHDLGVGVAKEEWADIPGYVGSYEVSDQGRVRSLKRVVVRRNGLRYQVQARVLKPARKPNGLRHVQLCLLGKRKRHYCHKLRRQAFGA